MGKVKEFYNQNKKVILLTGCCILGSTIVVGVVKYKLKKRSLVDMKGSNIIMWKSEPDGDKFINLERVKEILDANAETKGSFAIFREGLDPDKYACILLDGNVVVPEVKI